MRAVTIWVGFDVGQVNDPSTIAVLERVELQGDWDAEYYVWRKKALLHLRMLERVPLGTPYPEVVTRVRDVVQSRELAGRCQLVADATGVGKPVMDMLDAARLGCGLSKVMITGGNF